MIKLYKPNGGQTLYWEAWDSGEGAVIAHWGTLGKTGETLEVPLSSGERAEDVIDRESRERRSVGYQEIDLDDHAEIILQFQTKDFLGRRRRPGEAPHGRQSPQRMPRLDRQWSLRWGRHRQRYDQFVFVCR